MKKIMVLLLSLLCLLFAGCEKDSSVGVIGGADGPTAIFIAD